MNPNIVPWTDEEVARAKELYHNNELSAKQAAEIINKQFHRGISVRTRNSVLGKANRLGWSTAALSQYQARQPRLSVRQNKGMARPPREPQTAQIRQLPPQTPQTPQIVQNPLPVSIGHWPVLSIYDLRGRHCRYPIKGEGMDIVYCGKPTLPGSSWCEGCRKIVYRPFPQAGQADLNSPADRAQNNEPGAGETPGPKSDSAFPSKPLP